MCVHVYKHRVRRWSATGCIVLGLCLLVGGVGCSPPASGPTEEAELTPSEYSFVLYGTSVSISGDTAVIGGQGPVAPVFVRTATTWTQQAVLTTSAAAADDLDDFSPKLVSVSGDTALITGLIIGDNSGSVYVFVRDGMTWTQQAELIASNFAEGDSIGGNASISGDTALVPAFASDFSGSVYVFVRDGATWTQQAKLTPSDGAPRDVFGLSLSISGDTAVIFGGVEAAGAAYVFVRDGTTWTQQAKLTASDGAGDGRLGVGALVGFVSISGDTIMIGAQSDDHAGDDSGAAYVFVRDGTTWTQQAKLTASDGAEGDVFGFSVSVSGDTAVIGAPMTLTQSGGPGATYVFRYNGSSWTEVAKLTASDVAEGGTFGYSVSVSGDTAVIGTQFSAHVFRLP